MRRLRDEVVFARCIGEADRRGEAAQQRDDGPLRQRMENDAPLRRRQFDHTAASSLRARAILRAGDEIEDLAVAAQRPSSIGMTNGNF